MKDGDGIAEGSYNISYQKLSGMREIDIAIGMVNKQTERMHSQNE